jgi:hypothetical protein
MSAWRDRLRSWTVPLALLAVAVLSYGLWIPWLGMYGDDLPYMWYYHLLGPWGPGQFAAMDRPASSLFYAAVTFLLSENVWVYHVLLLVLRWLSGVLLWWILRLVWPERERESALVGLLFVVYPGFRQNPVALEFILHLAVLDLFLLSLGSMLMAVLHPTRRVVWRIVSMITAAGPFFLEYFIGLEILRPIFLWFLTRREGLSGKKQWVKLFTAWLPALGVVLAFVFWRVFIFSFRTYQPVLLDQLRASPIQGSIQLALTVLRDLRTSFVIAWGLAFQFPQNRRILLQDLLLMGISAGVVFFLLNRVRTGQPKTQPGIPAAKDYWGEMLLGIGLVAMLAGGAIFWLTGIQITVEFPWDRSTLSLMLGASMVAVGLIEMLAAPRYRLLLAVLLIGLAVGAHYQNALVYRAEWKKLQSFFWQLTWRAPGLEPGTLILFDVIPLNRYSDNDMTALLNWTYAPGLHTRQIPYKFFDLTIRLDDIYEGLPGLKKDLPIEHNHRGLFFKSNTSSTLAVQYNPPGCLIVLSPNDGDFPGLPGRLPDVLPLTRLEQIVPQADPARPPLQLGEEPQRDWCFYYQKAALARQEGDWSKITLLADQAAQADLHQNDPLELVPFIEGYACTDQWEKANQLTRDANQKSGLQPTLCRTWKNICGNQGASAQAAAMRAELGCTP